LITELDLIIISRWWLAKNLTISPVSKKKHLKKLKCSFFSAKCLKDIKVSNTNGG
jgi:hypothetical protein